MVDRPAPAPALLGGHSHLSRDEEPAARRLGVDLLTREQVRVLGQKLLEQAL